MKQTLSRYLSLGLLGILVSCASKLTPIKISNSTNASEEIATQGQMIEAGYLNQVDVLAADEFKQGREYFAEAKKLEQKGASNEAILGTLGYSKAYLSQASENASKAYSYLQEVTKARQQAITAGAKSFSKDMEQLDEELAAMSQGPSNKVNSEDKLTLQTKYMSLELLCIKNNKLGVLKKMHIEAKEKHADIITPNAMADAVNKLNIAEKLIESDRHSNYPIDSAVNVAMISATRVMSLLASEKTTRNQSPEQRAVALETKDNAIDSANSRTFVAKVDALNKDEELAEQNEVLQAQGASLAVSQEENTELKRKELDEKNVADAAAKFSPHEAEVYRQDGVLIIRLKSINFASGRSDLPSQSMNVLAKVKAIILDLAANEVTVQGHTDSLGQAKMNQILSEKRAESVMKYFASDKEIGNHKLASAGFGYSKPLATNKTDLGRAQNRRVDILIRTNHSY